MALEATESVRPEAPSHDRNGPLRRRSADAIIYAAIFGFAVFSTLSLITSAHEEYLEALERFRTVSSEKAHTVRATATSHLNQIYQNIRTISMLPSVMRIDRHGENIDADARMSIQQSYNNLASNVDVSEVYIVSEDLDPHAIDPVTGKPEEPIMMFDQLITAFSVKGGVAEGYHHQVEPQEEIEIEEFEQLQGLMSRLRQTHPTANIAQNLSVPFLSGTEVLTCDNTEYNHTLDDFDRTGVLFSVPFYGFDAKLKGTITAIVLSKALRQFVSDPHFALVNRATGVVTADAGTHPLRDSMPYIRKAEPDPELFYSQALPLEIGGRSSDWLLWAGYPNSHFLESPEVVRIISARNARLAFICGGALFVAFAWMFARRRQQFAQWRDLADASIEGLIITDGRVVLSANRSFCEFVEADDGALAGTPLQAIFSDAATLESLLATTGAPTETTLKSPSGGKVPIEAVCQRVSYLGADRHAIAVRDLREIRAAEENIRFLALHDPLTKLANRLRMHEELDRALARCVRGQPFAMLFVDLDRFKPVNDTYGHPVGDALLQQVAVRIRQVTRDCDLVSRIGGDEFAIVVTQIENMLDPLNLADRLIRRLSAPFTVGDQEISIGASVGIAVAPEHGQDAEILIKHADLALYRAKSDGRGVYRVFDQKMHAEFRERSSLEKDLQRAVSEKQFELVYQPIMSAASHRIVGFEALLRWCHPNRGLLAPHQFLEVLEDLGLMGALGSWVIATACRDAAAWPADLSLAVNVSARQFDAGNLEQIVRDALQSTGFDARRLELELTETSLLRGGDAVQNTLDQIRETGVRIVLDDFGTGYSSMSHLINFAVDRIKIDRSFVKNIGRDHTSTAIAQSIISLANNLDLSATAEGVETAEQVERLAEMGCSELQGDYWSKPLPVAELRSLIDLGEPTDGNRRLAATS